MAFENHMIASMNNPNAVEAWREASLQYKWKIFHSCRAADLEDQIDILYRTAARHQETIKQTQHELQASHEENRAVHKDLGEAHEVSRSALTLASTYSEAYFEQRFRACRAERTTLAVITATFTVVATQAIGLWGFLLSRLA